MLLQKEEFVCPEGRGGWSLLWGHQGTRGQGWREELQVCGESLLGVECTVIRPRGQSAGSVGDREERPVTWGYSARVSEDRDLTLSGTIWRLGSGGDLDLTSVCSNWSLWPM